MANDCTLRKFQRNLYFYGKLMTVRDFEMEQSYLNGKRHLLNRLVLGAGVACGLKVGATWDEAKQSVTLDVAAGVAIDAAGREIVVDRATTVAFVPDAAVPAYALWLRREECRIEPAPAPITDAGNVCGETCCYSRVREDYLLAVEQWSEALPPADDTWSGAFTTAATGGPDDIRELFRAHYERTVAGCPECEETCRVAVALLLRPGGGWNAAPQVIQNRLVHNNRELYELLRRHQTDLGNPHLTTAAQVGALKSVEGVANPGGNIDLIAANAIQITGDNNAKTIRIGESHSAIIGNPHSTTHDQTGPACVDPQNNDPACNKHIANGDAARWNRALRGLSADGGPAVENPGGVVDLVAGENITLSADPQQRKITVNAAGGGVSARTGRVTIATNGEGTGTFRLDSGFGNARFCVQAGVDFGEYVEYGPVQHYSGQVVVIAARVLKNPAGEFDLVVSAPQLAQRSVPVRWCAIPAVAAPEPTVTVTSPTYTVTSPTFTVTSPTFTITHPTYTVTVPTYTMTVPTMTVVTPTMRGPAIGRGPTVIVPPGGRGGAKLTDVTGIGPALAARLEAAGIATPAALASAAAATVAAAIGSTDLGKARRFIAEAKKLAKPS